LNFNPVKNLPQRLQIGIVQHVRFPFINAGGKRSGSAAQRTGFFLSDMNAQPFHSGPGKSLKRKLREQSMLAHEEELRRALDPLAADFDQWRQGRLESGALALKIHDWDRGPCNALFNKYNYGLHELNVAAAIVTGILNEKKVDAALLEYLSQTIALCRERLTSDAKSVESAPPSDVDHEPTLPAGGPGTRILPRRPRADG
jgi:hypothetical protein